MSATTDKAFASSLAQSTIETYLDSTGEIGNLARYTRELEVRRDQHLATINRLSRESVTPEEAEELRAQVASLTAALGTERAARQEAERRLDARCRRLNEVISETIIALHGDMDGGFTLYSSAEIVALRTAHAKTREVLRGVLRAYRSNTLTFDDVRAAEKRLKETGS